MQHFIVFIVALLLVYKSAEVALKQSSAVAVSLGLSKGTVGFLLIALISALPEAFISALAAFEGDPSLGLATLFGSNVADLTIVLALVAWLGGRDIKVESHILKNTGYFLSLLAVALLLGLDSYYSRLEGALLVCGGIFFHLHLLKGGAQGQLKIVAKFSFQNLLALILSMGFLLLGAHFTIDSAVEIASTLGVKPALVGMFLIALGTTLPELFFAIKAVRRKEDGLALGDILGTVLTDATILVGVIALIQPFSFDSRIVYSTGLIMLVSAGVVFYLMKTGKMLTKKEAILLALIYVLFVTLEWTVQ
jgi:cation:H+ antiporter